MRNYYDVLELDRTASNKQLASSLSAATPEQIADEDDLLAVMETVEWRQHYRRAHLQYDAIAATLNNPRLDMSLNSNQWDKRVVEFEPVANTIDFGQ